MLLTRGKSTGSRSLQMLWPFVTWVGGFGATQSYSEEPAICSLPSPIRSDLRFSAKMMLRGQSEGVCLLLWLLNGASMRCPSCWRKSHCLRATNLALLNWIFLLYFYVVTCGCDFFCTSAFVALHVKIDKEIWNLTTNNEFSHEKIMFILR